MKFWLIPLLMLVAFEATADIVAKQYSVTNKIYIGIGALVIYIIANIFWLISLKNGAELSTGAIIFSISSEILAVIIGLFIYHEQITRTQTVGIFLGLASLVFLLYE